MKKTNMTLSVNGEEQEVSFLPHKTLLEVLREDMQLTGTKHGCELGECGTCTVLIRRSHHIACLAAFLRPVAEQGMMVILSCSDPALSSVSFWG